MPGALPDIDARSSTLWDLVAEDARVERVASGFEFAEGPVWHPVDHRLLFSDIPASTRFAYSPQAGVAVESQATNRANGLTLDANLDLLACEHATSSVVRVRTDGTRETLASHFEGRELNSPNDVCVRTDGSIYFTDPLYGRYAAHGVERGPELGFQALYRIPPGGEPELLVERETYVQPNGLCFSLDESLLYVDDTARALVDVYEVRADGSLGPGRRLLSGIGSGRGSEGVVDGVKCDERGHVWVTGPGGIWVLGPDGEHLGVVRVPEVTSNLAWGGSDWKTLYVTASTSLYAVPTLVGPRREPFMRR
jgi:gluconolactonase